MEGKNSDINSQNNSKMNQENNQPNTGFGALFLKCSLFSSLLERLNPLEQWLIKRSCSWSQRNQQQSCHGAKCSAGGSWYSSTEVMELCQLAPAQHMSHCLASAGLDTKKAVTWQSFKNLPCLLLQPHKFYLQLQGYRLQIFCHQLHHAIHYL